MRPHYDKATSLGRVRGLGAALSGTGTFIAERFTSAALLFVTPFVIGFGVFLAGRDIDEVRNFIGSPWVAAVLIAFVVLSAEHMRMGMRVIVEDYVHGQVLRPLLLFVNTMLSWGSGLIATMALLRMAI